ncbi:MAG: MFS transporter, partial [Sporichthyaceae bacterium]|nr:MFS transporter [Sporichthyaceae bacterium]
PRVVPTDQLVAANSLSSLTRYTGAVVGPLLAGVLIPVIGLGTLYLLDTLALSVVLWAVAKLPAMPPLVGPQTFRMSGTLRQLGDGFRYLAGHRLLVALLAVDLAAMVLALPVALFPELAERTYGGPAGGGFELGLLFAAYPAGVLIAGLLSGTFSRVKRHGALMASAAMAWGGCVVLLGLTAHLWIALLALVVGGAVNFVLSTSRNAISQAYTDDALRGRIQGSLTVVLMGGPQLANLLHGFGGAVLGARWAISIGGVLTILTVAVLLRAAPELWRYQASSETIRSAHLGVLPTAAKPDQRRPGLRETADRLASAVRIRWRRALQAADPSWGDALALVSVVAPLVLCLRAVEAVGIVTHPSIGHSLGRWALYVWVIPWAVWPVVAVLALAGIRRTAASLGWVAGVALPLFGELGTELGFVGGPDNHPEWFALAVVAAAALTFSPGATRGRALLGRAAVIRLVAGTAMIAAAVTEVTVLGNLYRGNPDTGLWEDGGMAPAWLLFTIGTLLVGQVAFRVATPAARRAALVLALPVSVIFFSELQQLLYSGAGIFPGYDTEVFLHTTGPAMVLLTLLALAWRLEHQRDRPADPDDQPRRLQPRTAASSAVQPPEGP